MSRGFIPFGFLKPLALSALSLAMCACAVTATDGDPGERVQLAHETYFEHFSKDVPTGPGATIRILNHWGDIRVRSGAGVTVELDAAIQRIGDPFPARPVFEITGNSEGFEFAVDYPEASLDPRNGRVDIAAYIPDGSSVYLETLDGTIELKKTRVDFTAISSSGEILFINQGTADVITESGDIVARPIGPGWGALKLYSAAGSIKAYLPPGRGLEILARGTQEIRSDWPYTSEGTEHLILLGDQIEKRDRALITSGNTIEVREVLLRPDPQVE